MSGTTLRQVADERDTLRGLVAGLDADAVALDEAPELWAAFDQIERLATAAKTLLAARVDESGVWQRQGHRRPVDYLAKRSGSSVTEARAGLETSRRLRDLPDTRRALRRGDLSRSQAEAIADAAAANPGAERSLLDTAGRLSLSELREECGRAKAAGDRDREATYRRVHRGRRLRRYTDSQGAWNLVARGTPDAAALFNTALDPIIDEMFHRARRAGENEPTEAYAFDALIELARRARLNSHLDTTPEPTDAEPAAHAGPDPYAEPTTHGERAAQAGPTGSAGGPSDEPPPGDSEARTTVPAAAIDDRPPSGRGSADVGRRPARTDPTHLALIRVDLEALTRGATRGDEMCEVTGVGPIPVSVARRLLGDSILKLVITKGVDVLNVTHLGRGPTAAQRIALLWRSPTCTSEGCPNRYIEIDHRIPWARTRHTRLDELDPLCKSCHWLKTHQGWALVPGTGRRRLVPPHDPRHPDNHRPHSHAA